MPIVRKLGDLEAFCSNLLDKRNGNREIGFHNMKYAIAREFGFSAYITNSVMGALIEFGLIERISGADQFKITFMRDKKEINEDLDKYDAPKKKAGQ